MSYIDCESEESALSTLCRFYLTNSDNIKKFLLTIDLEDIYNSNWEKAPKVGAYEYLREIFEATFGTPITAIEKVYWFHLTRVFPDPTFDSLGILPLNEALDSIIWDGLVKNLNEPTSSEIRSLRQKGVPNQHFSQKTLNSLDQGPFGMLIRDAAFESKHMDNHDYLACPEIIEDICDGYKAKFGNSILESVSSILRPCIVKFESSTSTHDGLLTTVIYYCWGCVWNEPMDFDSNRCFDNKGQTIPPTAIISTAYLNSN